MTQYDAQIKQAILHPESAVREFAVRHFRESRSSDETIVPLVIQATETYGREHAFGVLRAADDLPLTVEAVEWLMQELQDDQAAPSREVENARFAMALLLCNPQSDLIPHRGLEILALPGFPEPLKPAIEDIIKMASWDWPTAWQNFLELGKNIRRRGELTTDGHRRLHRYVRSLARFHEEGGEHVLETLRFDYPGPQKELIYWLKPWLILLAGQMRLESAIPLLIKWLKSSYEAASDECGTALGEIGTDAVVDAVWKTWPRATEQERVGLTSALEPILSERCFETCEKLLRLKPEEDIAGMLGDRLLHQFDPRAIDIIRGMVKTAAPEIHGLKYDLVIVATIMGRIFPEYEQWFQEAKRDNFGWFDSSKPFRIADNFQTDASLKDAVVKLMAAHGTARLASDRATREQILDGILHPNAITRQMAVEYFANAYLPEPELLPRIIRAVRKYGREIGRMLFLPDGYYVHSEETLDWMIQELHEPISTQDELLSYHIVLARILLAVPPELLANRQWEIEQLTQIDPAFHERIRRRIEFSNLGPESLWEQLEALCEAEKDTRYLNEADLPLGYDLTEALARHPQFCTPKCLEVLSTEIEDYLGNPMTWMEGYMVYLSGLLKLSDAVPALLRWLHEDNDWLNPLAMDALTRIGTDSVVESLVEDYPISGREYRFSTPIVLGQIHSDLALVACLSVPDLEADPTFRTQWASSALRQFTPRAIEPARKLILADEDDPQLLDLREDLVAAADVLGTTFPEYEQWKVDLEHDRSRIRFEWKNEEREEEDERWDEEDLSHGQPTMTIVNEQPKVGRNDPCPCGSGKKYKKCCLNKQSSDPYIA